MKQIDTKLLIQREYIVNRKVQVGKDQENAQSEKDSHSKNRGGKPGTYTMKIYRKPNEQLFSQCAATQLPELN